MSGKLLAELKEKNDALVKREQEINETLVKMQREAEALILERSQNAAVYMNNSEIIGKLETAEGE